MELSARERVGQVADPAPAFSSINLAVSCCLPFNARNVSLDLWAALQASESFLSDLGSKDTSESSLKETLTTASFLDTTQ
jgi:hypothetical protein